MLVRVPDLMVGLGLGIGLCAVLLWLLAQPTPQGEQEKHARQPTEQHVSSSPPVSGNNQQQETKNVTGNEINENQSKGYWRAFCSFVANPATIFTPQNNLGLAP